MDIVSGAALPPGVRESVIPFQKKAWERALGGEEAAKPYIEARLLGRPSAPLVDRHKLPQTDSEFLWRLARDTWRGLEALRDRENGLPIDNVRLAYGPTGKIELRVADYTSITNIGLHLIGTVGAYEMRLISARQAVETIRKVLDTLNQLETYRGFFFNYYDTTSLERTSNFISFVDSAWLTAGLMVVRMTFPELAGHCTRLIRRTDYGFFYDPAMRQVSHGYYVSPGARSPYHYGVVYTEARLGSLIAIGKGDVPENHWFAMVRTFPADCAGQRLTPKAIRPKTVRGHEVTGGYYEWGGMRYVPSWGGSMFEALMPTLVLDELRYAPKSLGANDQVYATVQRRYALEELGYRVWGISSCATPGIDGYSAYGVTVLGSRGYDAGAVTPHASALALSVTPQPAIENLRALAERYEMYGEYGFYDAVDPQSGEVRHKYLALDQSMLFIALANYLDDHCIQKHFAADPIMQKVLPMIAEENFFE